MRPWYSSVGTLQGVHTGSSQRLNGMRSSMVSVRHTGRFRPPLPCLVTTLVSECNPMLGVARRGGSLPPWCCACCCCCCCGGRSVCRDGGATGVVGLGAGASPPGAPPVGLRGSGCLPNRSISLALELRSEDCAPAAAAASAAARDVGAARVALAPACWRPPMGGRRLFVCCCCFCCFCCFGNSELGDRLVGAPVERFGWRSD